MLGGPDILEARYGRGRFQQVLDLKEKRRFAAMTPAGWTVRSRHIGLG